MQIIYICYDSKGFIALSTWLLLNNNPHCKKSLVLADKYTLASYATILIQRYFKKLKIKRHIPN